MSTAVLTPCVEWSQCRDKDGYGVTRWEGRKARAHRVAWIKTHGPVPDGLLVLHRCDNPPCVAIDHLFLGTHRENMADRDAKGRQPKGDTHGLRMHPELAPRSLHNGNAKLSDEQVAEIRSRLTGRYGELKDLAAHYGVSFSLVSKIKAGDRRVAV